jgi:predicted alpha/beta hydrolase family esterase
VKLAETDVLMIPGLGNAGSGHWQRRWAERFPNAVWVEQADWNRPRLQDWVPTIERAVMMATRPVVLVAHALGVSAVVHAAQHFKDTKVRGAFLVAPTDPDSEALPSAARPFGHLPTDPLPFPSMLVASSSDPVCTVTRAVEFATAWGSDFHVARNAGRLDAASGHGPWPEGLMMFTRLMQRLKG